MNARDSIKPKTIRLAILMALADGAIATIDDLQTRMGEPRAKIANNVHPTMAEGLIKRLRDDVTRLPAYQITPKGREFMASFAGRKAEVSVAPDCQAIAVYDQSDVAHVRQPESETIEILRRQRDTAWSELSEIRKSITASPEESTLDEVKRVLFELAEALAMLELISEPVGYAIQRPAKPLVRFSKAEKAQARALSFARSGQRVQVFAMVPAGVAVPGAEWRPA